MEDAPSPVGSHSPWKLNSSLKTAWEAVAVCQRPPPREDPIWV